jgi:hypothetical protein
LYLTSVVMNIIGERIPTSTWRWNAI